MSEILVINPNSSTSVTRSMENCLAAVREASAHTIRCIELPKSPPGIETDEHVALVVPNLLEAASTEQADALVIACFSDPGIAQVRARLTTPVFGIAESAYLTALAMGSRFGIVSLGESSIRRHLRYLDTLGLTGRLAGDRSINKTVVQLMSEDVIQTVAATARVLRDEDGADVVILGCAGLGSYREALQDALGIPVVDPVQAAVGFARNALDVGYTRRKM
ncbi:aspartate/glutamate racemase family protein [Burkholderia cepacia]|uniref:aspartate/glutamate racemase family protein n=1 Tax=Burkholderia cepacia TaxID=292 RepID=UPI00158B7EFA|nr:aspartate/glutamate racemase family protein [Burkholderia cepacia]